MAISAKQKAARIKREAEAPVPKETGSFDKKQCTCLVAIRGRGQHAIGCALYNE